MSYHYIHNSEHASREAIFKNCTIITEPKEGEMDKLIAENGKKYKILKSITPVEFLVIRDKAKGIKGSWCKHFGTDISFLMNQGDGNETISLESYRALIDNSPKFIEYATAWGIIKEIQRFEPFSLVLDIENEDELRDLWHRLNICGLKIYNTEEYKAGSCSVDFPKDRSQSRMWDIIDGVVSKLNLKKAPENKASELRRKAVEAMKNAPQYPQYEEWENIYGKFI
jgi:hypothetical protein